MKGGKGEGKNGFAEGNEFGCHAKGLAVQMGNTRILKRDGDGKKMEYKRDQLENSGRKGKDERNNSKSVWISYGGAQLKRMN